MPEIQNVVEAKLEELLFKIEPFLASCEMERTFGSELARLFPKSKSRRLLQLVLQADVLRVSFICLYADGVLSGKEARIVRGLTSELARSLSKLRPKKYGPFAALTDETVGRFFKDYWSDDKPFGFKCSLTKWQGIKTCMVFDAERQRNTATHTLCSCLLELAKTLTEIDAVDCSQNEAYSVLARDLKSYRDKRFDAEEFAWDLISEAPFEASPERWEELDDDEEDFESVELQDDEEEFESEEDFEDFESVEIEDEALPTRARTHSEKMSAHSQSLQPNLQECPDCFRGVSKRAASCPHCGCPLTGKATEARLTVFRNYVETGSARRTAVVVNGRHVADLTAMEGQTFVLPPGELNVEFYSYGLLSGGKSLLKHVPVVVDAGQHLVINFTPNGGFFEGEFVHEVSRKLD